MKKNKALDVTVNFEIDQRRVGTDIKETVVRPGYQIDLSWKITIDAIIFELAQEGHPQTREQIKNKIKTLASDRVDELFDSVTFKPYAKILRSG